MKLYYNDNEELSVGIDEAGRGSLFGPVCISGVILNDINYNPPPYEIIDSKKCSPNKRKELRKYIEENAIAYDVQFIDEKIIDDINILNATMKGMHLCLDNITKNVDIDRILVDGNYFNMYNNNNFEFIPHVCIPSGDNLYYNIAAASILAKEYRDEFVINLCNDNNTLLNKYDILNNKGYGTKNHLTAIKNHGKTKWHRKSFNIK